VESSNPHEQHNHTTNSKLQVGDGDGKWEHFQHLEKNPKPFPKKPLPKIILLEMGRISAPGKKEKKRKTKPTYFPKSPSSKTNSS
jgi:hypothetical protein